ncbi:hypothetical protein BX666DRAFT_1920373 [Dichotomocladium elegans]|nr:hypothetical protein BX666DRAFT_1920373 [Dichotomocladium elegans]
MFMSVTAVTVGVVSASLSGSCVTICELSNRLDASDTPERLFRRGVIGRNKQTGDSSRRACFVAGVMGMSVGSETSNSSERVRF